MILCFVIQLCTYVHSREAKESQLLSYPNVRLIGPGFSRVSSFSCSRPDSRARFSHPVASVCPSARPSIRTYVHPPSAIDSGFRAAFFISAFAFSKSGHACRLISSAFFLVSRFAISLALSVKRSALFNCLVPLFFFLSPSKISTHSNVVCGERGERKVEGERRYRG